MGPNYNYNKQQQEAKSRKQELGANQLQPRGGCAPFSTICSGINAAYLSTVLQYSVLSERQTIRNIMFIS